MKQNDVKIGSVYLTRINRRLVRVRVKSRAEADRRMGEKGQTLFVTVREVPAAHEGGLMSREFPRSARELQPLPVKSPKPGEPGYREAMAAQGFATPDLSGDPAHDTATGGEPVPGRGDR